MTKQNDDDPVLNCVLEVCCLAGSSAQAGALAKYLSDGLGVSADEAMPYCVWILNNFDLAEKGTLSAFKASIARLARGQNYNP